MALKFSSANVVYIRNLSPLASENTIREMFAKTVGPDGKNLNSRLVRIVFQLFPGSSQRYCELEFSDSGGVTLATSLNGEVLQGVPLAVSVMNPLSQSMSSPGSISNADTAASQHPSPDQYFQQTELLNMALQTQLENAQAVQLASIHARQLAEQKKLTLPSLISPNNPEAQISEESYVLRTIHVSNIPIQHMAHDVQKLFADFGEIANLRVDTTHSDLMQKAHVTNRFALVEFASKEQADKVLEKKSRIVDGVTLEFSRALVPVLPVEPSNVRFDLSVLPPIPVAYHQVHRIKMDEKYARVVEMEPSISKRIIKRARGLA